MECLKCGFEFEGNFCPQCGQKVLKGRISVDQITEETFSSIDIGRGFFRALLILFTTPGRSIRNHIERTELLFNPFKLLLIVGAVSTFVTATLFDFSLEDSLHFLHLPKQNEYGLYSGQYFTFTNLIGIPLFAFSSWLVFIRSKYNYLEHLILNIYVACGQMIIIIIAGPFNYYLGQSDLLIRLMFIAQIIYMVWFYIGFFDGKKIVVSVKCLLLQAFGTVMAFFANYLIFLVIPNSVLEFFEIF